MGVKGAHRIDKKSTLVRVGETRGNRGPGGYTFLSTPPVGKTRRCRGCFDPKATRPCYVKFTAGRVNFFFFFRVRLDCNVYIQFDGHQRGQCLRLNLVYGSAFYWGTSRPHNCTNGVYGILNCSAGTYNRQ